MDERRFALELPGGRTLVGLLDLPARARGGGPSPVVVLCHGFKGFARWGFFPPLAELLAARGFAAVRFNFTGSGMGLDDDRVTRPEDFREDSYRAEVAELRLLLDRLGEVAPGALDLDRLALLGHSRGGAIALLTAAATPWREPLRALVTWNAIGHCDRWTAVEKERWRSEGELPVTNARTGQRLALGLGLLDDVEGHAPELDLHAAALRRRAPWLLLHGTADESVRFAEGQALARTVSPESAPLELHPIAEGSHTFGARHPFAGPTPHLVAAMNLTQRFLRRHLAP
ncbi:MAG: alpha/beta fold hydrolase [Holophagales bacterium]|nr:MAG: alpha/beta fold hydrolase [Holophagales bacterium]